MTSASFQELEQQVVCVVEPQNVRLHRNGDCKPRPIGQHQQKMIQAGRKKWLPI
jgi:hypothetical protein